MASARVTVFLLWSLPLVAVAGLAAWAFLDVLAVPKSGLVQSLVVVLLAGLAAIAVGLRFRSPVLGRFGLVLVVGTYFGAHVFVLPMDPAAALLYLTLALVAVELRILANRFAPIYAENLEPEDRRRLTEALQRSALRIVAVAGVAFLGSYLAADLALAGTLPARTIATALLLSAALIAVILMLALWPVFERRRTWAAREEPPIQTPK